MKISKLIQNITKGAYFKEVLLGSSLSFFFKVVNYLLGFAYIFIIARFYSIEAQGIFSIVYTILLLSVLISKFGINTSSLKWISIHFEEKELNNAKEIFFRGLYLTIFFSSVISGALFLSGGAIATLFFKKESLEIPIKVISLSIPFMTPLEMISSYFLAKRNVFMYGLYFFVSKFVFPLSLLCALLLLNYNEDIIPVYCYTIGIAFSGAISLIHIYFDTRKLGKVRGLFDFRAIKKLVKESFPLLLSSSLVMIMWWSDTFILGVFGTEKEVGIYSIAVKLASITTFVYNAISTILQPKIAHCYRIGNSIELGKVLKYSSKVILFTSLPVAIALGVFPKFFLSIFGEEYKSGYLVLLLLLLAQFINTLTGPVGSFLSMTGNERFQFKIIFVSLILNMIVSLLLVNKYGGEGVALGSAIGMIFWNIAGAIYIKTKLGYQTWLKV